MYVRPGARRPMWGRAGRITLHTDFSCSWQAGTSCRRREAAPQHQKGTFPTILTAHRWRRAPPSPPPPRHGGKGQLCSRAGFLYASRNHRLFLSVSPEGLATRGQRRRVRAPEEDALPQEGTAPVNIPAEPKRSAPLPSGKGTSENENILVDCFSKRCKTVNIYMEIWVLNNC